ncbi:MAG: hypothetical protein WAK20_03065 [Candidatus Acidiferrum sp.]
MGNGNLQPASGTTGKRETQWVTVLPDGLKVVYRKVQDSTGFIYSCRCIIGDMIKETNWESSEDLSQEQVELLPKFIDFLAGIV